jgi:flagellar export protein FliJ
VDPFPALVRLAKRKVEAAQLILAEKIAVVEELRNQYTAIEAERAAERSFANRFGTGFQTLGAYLQASNASLRRLDAQIENAGLEVAAARTDVTAAFAAQKRLEIVAEARAEKVRRARSKRESDALDEVAMLRAARE